MKEILLFSLVYFGAYEVIQGISIQRISISRRRIRIYMAWKGGFRKSRMSVCAMCFRADRPSMPLHILQSLLAVHRIDAAER